VLKQNTFLAPRRVLVLIQVGVASLRRAKHTPRNKKEQRANPKPSGAELCAEPLAQASAAALGGFLDPCAFICHPLCRVAFLLSSQGRCLLCKVPARYRVLKSKIFGKNFTENGKCRQL